ncbi:S-adenosyl-L-methionine-dependent methyltransferase [Gamsiella multidivaricata]|uniref:S-adenosyl-L-methionine-dependent methyltransferase n=1 Tax=Gamsiella multidivaricata TaxID=101098 RepID=UPI00221E67B6|nr:S-adenosyl-L-methionine-dependent methyltransferase [Gamsiella multidivaricata]KAG0351315.1 hypothetical protein BGZ54_003321 [Gamsiella multidivaricata]KAI7827576.1 S-adenosyl-L-methionine-dependent methyltransferase [Gamsiella multidivaricata]
MNTRFGFFLVLVVSLTLSTVYPAEQKSRFESLFPVLLGFLLGLLVAETPLASRLQELLGLSSRHPDKVGLDILHSQGSSEGKNAKSQLDQKVMYGLQHAFLNLEVTGWWFNMGLWDEEKKPMRFQDACKALVEKVTSKIGINQQSHILDVGFGCGDQDVYMAELYQPARITGITIEPIQHHAAQELIKRTKLPGTEIQLYVADASKLPEFLESTPTVFSKRPSTSSTPSATSITTGQHFTHVVSIDSAYHYNTRAQFLKNALKVLQPETGRLAMADMILARPAPTSGLGRSIFEAVFKAMEVPVENMKTMEEYKQDLVNAGFVDIEIECIEDRVFSGLAGYIENQMGRLGGLVKPGVNWTYWALCKGLWWLDRSKWLHFVVVAARSGPASQ